MSSPSEEKKVTNAIKPKQMSTTAKIMFAVIFIVVILVIVGLAYMQFKKSMAEVKVASSGVDDLSKFGENWLKAAYPKNK